MKDVTMKKTSFINGALITTIAIFITKILGIIYVIPFHQVIGDEGGALYGYAYTIYLFFISISTAGIPLSISRVVSEYQALGYYSVKKRAFIIGKRISALLGLISFLIIIIFAPFIAKLILGDVVGGSSIKDVTFVIRVIGIAILIVPILSVYRGYFEGHRFMGPPSVSQILEQIFRVIIIIFGSYLMLDVFKCSLTSTVGVALLGASVGALVSYLYLLNKYLKNRKRFNERVRPVNEPLINDHMIVKKILMYAIPFIMIDVFRSLYNYVDMFTVVKGLVKISNYNASDAEVIYSMLSTWCQKFNMILLAVSSGVVVSLIPNLTESLVKKDEKNIQKRVGASLNVLLYLTIPMAVGVSFLAKPIWTLFYGNSTFGPKVLCYYIFVGFIIGLFTCVVSILQTFKDYRYVFISLCSGLLVKLLLNMSLLRTFYNMGLPPYYGVITATIIGFFVSIIIGLIVLYQKYGIKFEGVLKHFIDIICGALVMVCALLILKIFVPVYSSVRIVNLFIIILYACVGSLVYFVYSRLSKLDKDIFGSNSIVKSIRKIIIKK